MQNLFHPDSGLPDFNQFTPDNLPNILPLIETGIQDIRSLADRLTNVNEPTWESVVEVLSTHYETLGQAWGVVSHLHGTQDSPVVREVYNHLLPLMTELATWLSQHQGLCTQWEKMAASSTFKSLPSARQHAINKSLRDFRLSGAALSEKERARFMTIEQRIAECSAQFSENILDDTNAFSYNTEQVHELKGLPEDVLCRARERSASQNKSGYTLTLQSPDYLAVMEYAESPTLREHFYRHYVTRASDLLPDGSTREHHPKDNSALMAELLALRHEKAQCLGFSQYTALSLEGKMAKTPDEVETFLQDLARQTRPYAEKEWASLQSFAEQHRSSSTPLTLMPWDIPYYSRLAREDLFNYTDEEIKPYFPAPKVLKGLFSLCNKMFGVTMVEEPTSVWDPAVKFFRIINADGKKRGGFYVDLYARDNKKSGAWMDEVLARGHYRQAFHYPIAYLITNFSCPTSSQPALLTMDEVITLLHEMGHVLHHVMSEVDDLPTTGIRGVEWDAVELPSQFMENFAWNFDILSWFSAHVDSGKTLPRNLFDKLLASKNYQSGLAMLRQLEFALFDWRIHQSPSPHVLSILNDVRREVAIIQPPSFNRFPHAFSHIFAGGYSAGYYAYKWAEVLSCDGFGLFEDLLQDHSTAPSLQPLSALKEVGNKFWQCILSVGGTRPARDSFQAFRGRDPKIDAMLFMNGLSS